MYVWAYLLRTYNSTSCGCNKSHDLIGKRFTDLVIMSTDYSKGRRYWLCKCVCGKEVIASGYELEKKIITSCGCGASKNATVFDVIEETRKTIMTLKETLEGCSNALKKIDLYLIK
jgi:hypothetical protein